MFLFDPRVCAAEKTNTTSEPTEKVPELDEAAKKIARELIDDFGFTNPAPGITTLLEQASITGAALQDDIDPFDTSYIDIEAIKSGGAVKGVELIKDIEIKELDPFDTSHIESVISQDTTVAESSAS